MVTRSSAIQTKCAKLFEVSERSEGNEIEEGVRVRVVGVRLIGSVEESEREDEEDYGEKCDCVFLCAPFFEENYKIAKTKVVGYGTVRRRQRHIAGW